MTNTVIPFDEPILRTGRREIPSDRQQDYSSLTLDLGYRINNRIAFYLAFDQGIHLGATVSESKQNRARLALGLRGVLLK